MKKLILSIIALISFFSLSFGFEGNIKVGYDFFRQSTGIIMQTRNGKTDTTTAFNEYGKGFVIGVELFPITLKDERIKLGVGVEYNFGEKKLKYTKNGEFELVTMIPLYATAKFTYYRPKNIDLNLYTFARLGYAFATEGSRFNNTSGAYYGLGLGIDYKYFLAEILYDGKYKVFDIPITSIPNGNTKHIIHDFNHKIGIRLGLQLGTQHFKKAKIEPKIVEKIVEVEKVVEKKTTNKIIIKNFDISAEALFGFNKYKLEDLKEGGKQEIEEKVKELLKSGFEITGINVIGHTDRLGTDAYNYKLGLNRANTIAEYLKELGIKVEIKSSSKGKKEPKVHCNNVKSTSKLKDCLQPNRRVELQFLGLETQQNIEEDKINN